MDVIRIAANLRIWMGCVKENFLCLKEIATYRKSMITKKSKNIRM